jgi:hypothetical protein
MPEVNRNGTHVTFVSGISLHLPGWATDGEIRALIAGSDQVLRHVEHLLDTLLNHYAPGRAGGDL